MIGDVCGDIISLIEDAGLGVHGVDLFSRVDFDYKGELRGILVENPSPGTIPDVLTETDTVGIDITVCKGVGDRGRTQTTELAFQIFKLLSLKTDITVNGTLYPLITAVNSPYEIKRDDRYYRAFRVEVTRYYGGIQ